MEFENFSLFVRFGIADLNESARFCAEIRKRILRFFSAEEVCGMRVFEKYSDDTDGYPIPSYTVALTDTSLKHARELYRIFSMADELVPLTLFARCYPQHNEMTAVDGWTCLGRTDKKGEVISEVPAESKMRFTGIDHKVPKRFERRELFLTQRECARCLHGTGKGFHVIPIADEPENNIMRIAFWTGARRFETDGFVGYTMYDGRTILIPKGTADSNGFVQLKQKGCDSFLLYSDIFPEELLPQVSVKCIGSVAELLKEYPTLHAKFRSVLKAAEISKKAAEILIRNEFETEGLNII